MCIIGLCDHSTLIRVRLCLTTPVPGSNEKVWWICKRKHEWKTTVTHRALNERGCPYCTNQSSRNELRILAELSFMTGDTAHRPKIGKYEYDIVLEAQKVAIEYDGSYWHEAKEDLDVIKTEFAEESGYRILRVRETPLNKVRSEDIIIFLQPVTRLEPRAFSVGGVDSLDGGFVW